MDHRTFDIKNLTIRDGTDGQSQKISGYASVFNCPTTISNAWEEIIAPGAFENSLSKGADVRALFNHNWENVLGRVSAGTLTLNEDEHGLAFTDELPNTSLARDLSVLIKRGDVNECSFGFIITGEEWDYDGDMPKRTITDVDLYEISIATLPQYKGTEATLVRSKDKILKSINNRKMLLTKIKDGLNQCMNI